MLNQTGLDRVEFYRDACELYRVKEDMCVIDGASLSHAVFQITNPEAMVNVRSLKEYLDDANVN